MKLSVLIITLLISTFAHSRSEKETDILLTGLYGEYKPYKVFFFNLKEKTKNNDAIGLSKLMKYPLLVTDGDISGYILDEKEFIKKYRNIFIPKVKNFILEKEYSNWYGNWRGLIYGNGNIWVNGTCANITSQNECIGLSIKVETIHK